MTGYLREFSHLRSGWGYEEKRSKAVAERAVRTFFDVDEETLADRSRKRENTRMRHLLGWLLYFKHHLTYKRTGQIYGYDHTSVIYGVKDVDRMPIDVVRRLVAVHEKDTKLC